MEGLGLFFHFGIKYNNAVVVLVEKSAHEILNVFSGERVDQVG